MNGRKKVLSYLLTVAMLFTLIGNVPIGVYAQPADDTQLESKTIAETTYERTEAQNGTEMMTREKTAALKSLATEVTVNKASAGEEGGGKESVTVYFTLSEDGKFVTGNDDESTLLSHVPVTIDYFDLADYGLEDFYRYESEAPEEGGAYTGTEVIKQPTVLHLYIKMLEQYYLNGATLSPDSDALTITGSSTSMYMKKFWGHDENLMYFVDHAYPVMTAGWGATADYLLLEDGMEIDVAMFNDWGFYISGAFASFTPTVKIVAAGEEFALKLKGTGTSMDESSTDKKMAGEDIVYAKKDDTYGGNSNDSWKLWDGKTDDNGNITMSFAEPGVYYISSTPLYQTFSMDTGEPCVAPPIATITVTGDSPQGDDTGTEGLTVLSDLYFSDRTNPAAETYEMNTEFNATTNTYTVYVPDYKDSIAVWGKATSEAAAVSAKSRIKVSYTDTAGETQEKEGLADADSGMNLARLIAKGDGAASCMVTAKCGKSSQEYTVNIERVPTLSSMTIYDADDAKRKYSPEFSGSCKEYTVKIPENSAGAYIELELFAEEYTVTVNGEAPTTSGKTQLDLTQAKTLIKVSSSAGRENTYKLNIVSSKRTKCTFYNLIAGTVVHVSDSENEDVLKARAGSDNDALEATGLLEEQTYTYSITRKGYVGVSGTFIAGQEDKIIDGRLVKAEVNPEIDASIKSLWPNFRGSISNNGLTATKTAYNAQDAELLWAVKNGGGWSGAPSSPIIVGDDIVFSTNKEIVKVDRATGQIKQRGEMAYKSTFSLTPPTYAEGMIFIALADGRVQAFNADTLESLWVYNDAQKGQPDSPITYKNGYVYTGFWNSEDRTANYVCLSATDEDPSKTAERKTATWTYSHLGGFYWAGSCVTDEAVIVGSETCSDNGITGTSVLYSFDPETGQVQDKLDVKGNVRSTVAYDEATEQYCFTTQGGFFYMLKMSSGGKFDQSSVKRIELHPVDADGVIDSSAQGSSSSTPVVYNGRAYVGVTGSKPLTAYDGHNISVIDLAEEKVAYCIPTRGYAQTSGLLTTGYESDDGYCYVYFIENYTPGILRVLKDKAGQKTAILNSSDNGGILGEDKHDLKYADTLFTPRGEQAQYAICSPIVDEYGTIYYKNDSSYMMALGSKIESIEISEEPDKVSYDEGETFDPEGMIVTAHLANGMTRDITKYVTYTTEPLSTYDLEVEISYNHVMYNDKAKKIDPHTAYVSIASINKEERAAVDNAVKLIAAISAAEGDDARRKAVEEARSAYDDLGYRLQKYVDKANLVKAETEIANADLRSGTASPVIKAAQESYNTVRLSWNKNAKADGYEIYRSTAKDMRGTLVKDIKDNSILTMTNGVTTGTTYYYTLRPYISVDGEPAGDLYAQCEGKTELLAPTSLKAASATYSSIKLSWKKAEGAQGYKLYRYDAKTGKYSLIKTITSGTTVTYTNTGLATGTKYYYRLTSCRGSAGSKYSAVVSAAPKLGVPVSFKAASGKRKAIVSWKKVSGASGYVVYRSVKKSSGFKVVKTIKKGSTVKFTNASLKKGKSYYYKVRAYRTVGSKKVYSSYTTVKKVKIK